MKYIISLVMTVALSPEYTHAARSTQVTSQAWSPRIPQYYDLATGSCKYPNASARYPYEEVFACNLLAGSPKMGTYKDSTSINVLPSMKTFQLNTNIFRPNAVANMIKQGCFSMVMFMGGARNQSRYEYAGFQDYKETLKGEFGLNIKGEAGWDPVGWDLLSSKITADFMAKGEGVVIGEGVNQKAGGRVHDHTHIAKLTNKCLSPCTSSSNSCIDPFLSDDVRNDLSDWAANPTDIELAHTFSQKYGTILPKSWIFGFQKSTSFDVKYSSKASLTRLELEAALKVVVNHFGTDGEVDARIQADWEKATNGTSSTLLVNNFTYPTAAQKKCQSTQGVKGCFDYFASDVNRFGVAVAATNHVDIGEIALENYTDVATKMAMSLYIAETGCTSLFAKYPNNTRVYPTAKTPQVHNEASYYALRSRENTTTPWKYLNIAGDHPNWSSSLETVFLQYNVSTKVPFESRLYTKFLAVDARTFKRGGYLAIEKGSLITSSPEHPNSTFEYDPVFGMLCLWDDTNTCIGPDGKVGEYLYEDIKLAGLNGYHLHPDSLAPIAPCMA